MLHTIFHWNEDNYVIQLTTEMHVIALNSHLRTMHCHNQGISYLAKQIISIACAVYDMIVFINCSYLCIIEQQFE